MYIIELSYTTCECCYRFESLANNPVDALSDAFTQLIHAAADPLTAHLFQHRLANGRPVGPTEVSIRRVDHTDTPDPAEEILNTSEETVDRLTAQQANANWN